MVVLGPSGARHWFPFLPLYGACFLGSLAPTAQPRDSTLESVFMHSWGAANFINIRKH